MDKEDELQEKIEKLEGWLQYLWFTSQDEWVRFAIKEQEISDYIKAMGRRL